MNKEDIENRIREFFDENYEILRQQGGHSLTNDTREQALRQVLDYWKKLNNIATKVSETEVKLSLPNRKTKKGVPFAIEGVVDIVREAGDTWMYDIKTHDPDYICDNKKLYENQLNVYAYIWQKLRNNQLNHTAIISTEYPQSLRKALLTGNGDEIKKEYENWNPLIDIPFGKKNVDAVVEDFADTVDAIEQKCFKPVPTKRLSEKDRNTRNAFGVRVCRNCDARFSCSSYREYVLSTQGKQRIRFAKYYDSEVDMDERDERVDANLSG